jgi:hypothetical protein
MINANYIENTLIHALVSFPDVFNFILTVVNDFDLLIIIILLDCGERDSDKIDWTYTSVMTRRQGFKPPHHALQRF